jgi:hypothetical protein
MTVYLYCEGPTDFAVIAPFMKNITGDKNLDIQWKKRPDLKKFASLRSQEFPLTGSYKMISALATVAKLNKCNHIAYHRNSDRKGYNKIYREVNTTLEKIRKSGMSCIAIIPKEMIESWVLADEQAYPEVPSNPPLPSKPNEEIWGKESVTYPKRYAERVLKQFHQDPVSGIFAEIAEKSRIAVLRKRCPISFGKFYADMQTFIPSEKTSY